LIVVLIRIVTILISMKTTARNLWDRSRRTVAITLPLTVLALVVAGCGGADSGSQQDGLSVVVTTTILGDIVSNVVGTRGTVEVLMPIGADPHEFQPSSSQVAAMQTADLVVANGLGLEEAMSDVLASLESDGANLFKVAALLDPNMLGGPGTPCDPTDDQTSLSTCDPHVWMDPLRMAESARLIAAELSKVDSEFDWHAAADEYAAELEKLDAEISIELATVADANRRLVTNHDALGYFASRYGFAIVGTIIPGGATLGNPSSADLAALVKVMEDETVSVIFAETTEPTVLAETLASELGREVSVVELYTGSLGGPGSGAETYEDMLKTNTRLIVEALS
jgi:zinc/manganese transport system substrate-binding protein